MSAPGPLSRLDAVVVAEVAPDGVGELSFERADGFFVSFAFGSFAVVVVPAGSGAAELVDRGDVERVVHASVAGGVEPVAGGRS